MNFHRTLWALGLCVTLSSVARADITILTTEHVDIGIAYEAGQWDLHVHDEDNEIEYSPDVFGTEPSALLFAGTNTRISRPAGIQWNFLGVGAGENIWVLPQTQDPTKLFLGVAAEEIASGTFASYVNTDTRIGSATPAEWVSLALTNVSGPGDFSIWATDLFGSPVVWMASSDGISASDILFQIVGGHSHFNFGFSQPGLYGITFQATGFAGPGQTNPITSDPVTYYFGIETTAVPEPSTYALVGLVSVAGLLLRRRSRQLAMA